MDSCWPGLHTKDSARSFRIWIPVDMFSSASCEDPSSCPKYLHKDGIAGCGVIPSNSLSALPTHMYFSKPALGCIRTAWRKVKIALSGLPTSASMLPKAVSTFGSRGARCNACSIWVWALSTSPVLRNSCAVATCSSACKAKRIAVQQHTLRWSWPPQPPSCKPLTNPQLNGIYTPCQHLWCLQPFVVRDGQPRLRSLPCDGPSAFDGIDTTCVVSHAARPFSTGTKRLCTLPFRLACSGGIYIQPLFRSAWRAFCRSGMHSQFSDVDTLHI